MRSAVVFLVSLSLTSGLRIKLAATQSTTDPPLLIATGPTEDVNQVHFEEPSAPDGLIEPSPILTPDHVTLAPAEPTLIFDGHDDKKSSNKNDQPIIPDDGHPDEKIEQLKKLYEKVNADEQIQEEHKEGSNSELFLHPHFGHPDTYKDLDRRRFMGQVRGEDDKAHTSTKDNQEDESLKPVEVSPELMLAVAENSARLGALEPPVDPNEYTKQALRNGDYWNSYKVVKVAPALRSGKETVDTTKLEGVYTKLSPGSRLERLVSILKTVSPRLIYIINTNDIL